MSQEKEISIARRPADRALSGFALAALLLGLAVALVAMFAGLGHRLGIWHYRTGFTMVEWAVYGGFVVGLLALIGLVRTRPGGPRRGLPLALAALLIALVVVTLPWQQRRASRAVPPIHDIATDTENPPMFVAIVPLRADAPNPVEYAGEEAAALQRSAYPDVRPVVLDLPADQAFERALEAVRRRGWRLVDANPAEGRIEATDRTFWFGFYDDVVIRLSPLDGRTVIDVRSKSRVGRGDRGANANRIRRFLREVET